MFSFVFDGDVSPTPVSLPSPTAPRSWSLIWKSAVDRCDGDQMLRTCPLWERAWWAEGRRGAPLKPGAEVSFVRVGGWRDKGIAGGWIVGGG